MFKQLLIALAIILILIISVTAFLHKVKKAGIDSEVKKNQEIQIEEQTKTIKTKVFQAKLVSKITINRNAAARDRWLQLIWKERNEIQQ